MPKSWQPALPNLRSGGRVSLNSFRVPREHEAAGGEHVIARGASGADSTEWRLPGEMPPRGTNTLEVPSSSPPEGRLFNMSPQ